MRKTVIIPDQRERPPRTKEEIKQDLEQLRKVRQNAELLVNDPQEYARLQGMGIAEHLQEFVKGNEGTFNRYFVITDPHHAQIHESFLEATQNKFPTMSITEHGGDSRNIQVEFTEYGAGIRARVDRDSDNNPFGIYYEGYAVVDRPSELLGSMVTRSAVGSF